MTTTFNLTGPGFPVGTVVGAYPLSARVSEGPPAANPINTQTMTASGLIFTGLSYATRYVAYAEVAGHSHYVAFQTAADPLAAVATLADVKRMIEEEGAGGGGVTKLELEGRQPLDSDLTAIAALSTTSYGRSLLTQATALAARSTIGVDAAGAAAAAQAASQPLDSDLTAIAGLTTTAAGRALLTKSSVAALREYLEVGVESPGTGVTPFFDGSFQTGTKTAYELEQAPQPGGGTEKSPPNTSSERCYIISEAPSGTSLKYACRFKYVAGDPVVAGSQRSELQRPSPYEYPGEHIWIDEWIRVPEYDSTHYTLLRQFHEIEEPVGVAVGLYLEGTELKLHPGSGSSWWTKTYPGLNTWFHVKIHIYFHQTEGIIEVWYGKAGEKAAKQVLANGKEVYTATNTLNGSNVGGATHVYDKVGVLRSNSAVGTTVVDHSGTKMFNTDPGELY